MTLLPIHIVAASIALVTGFLALFVLKGARLHRRSGMVFVVAMLVLGISGAVLATLEFNLGNLIGRARWPYISSRPRCSRSVVRPREPIGRISPPC